MAGLLKMRRGRKGQRNARPDPNDLDDEPQNVTPEEQEQYNRFVTNGMLLMYEKERLPTLLKTIAGDGNPVEGIANALVSIVSRLDDSADKAGAQVSGDIKYQGGVELMEQLVELAENAGIHTFSDKEMEDATLLALDTYRASKQQAGALPVDELSQDFEALLAAEESGELEQVLPGVNEYAKNAPQPTDMMGQKRKRV